MKQLLNNLQSCLSGFWREYRNYIILVVAIFAVITSANVITNCRHIRQEKQRLKLEAQRTRDSLAVAMHDSATAIIRDSVRKYETKTDSLIRRYEKLSDSVNRGLGADERRRRIRSKIQNR